MTACTGLPSFDTIIVRMTLSRLLTGHLRLPRTTTQAARLPNCVAKSSCSWSTVWTGTHSLTEKSPIYRPGTFICPILTLLKRNRCLKTQLKLISRQKWLRRAIEWELSSRARWYRPWSSCHRRRQPTARIVVITSRLVPVNFSGKMLWFIFARSPSIRRTGHAWWPSKSCALTVRFE